MEKKKIDYNKEIPFIRRLCPHLKGRELEEAEERFRQYVRICLDIHRELEIKREIKRQSRNFDRNSNEFYNGRKELNSNNEE